MSFTKSKTITTLGIAAFLTMSFWGLYSMPTNEDGEMVNCPFVNSSATVCSMSANEHIFKWKQLFVITSKNSLLPFIVLLIFVLAAFFLVTTKIYNKSLLQCFHKYLCKNKPEIKLFNYFILAFSQGILNSRIYS